MSSAKFDIVGLLLIRFLTMEPQATTPSSSPIQTPQKKSSGNATLIGLIIAIIVIAGLAFAYKSFKSSSATPAPATIQSTTPSSAPAASAQPQSSLNSGDPTLDQESQAVDQDLNQATQDVNSANVPSEQDLNI